MDCLTLLAEARMAGLTASIDAGRLVVRGPRSADVIARRLLQNKVAIIDALANSLTMSGNGNTSLKTPKEAGLLLPPISKTYGFEQLDAWQLPGYQPGHRIIRDGIEHKREDCNGQRGWRHVWGGRFCCDCWPCTDAAAMVPEVGVLQQESSS
jgi:hypothetical protein